ncbi:MAG: NAD-dependent epimerase/dehydratase family protein [Oceanicaulis sp.]
MTAETEASSPALDIARDAPVMVTGATGYVAGRLIERLLELGLTVHATVRDPANEEKRAALDALAARSAGEIRYFKADLENPEDFDAPMAGCRVVFHTASPFRLDIKDAKRDLVDPAVNGARNALGAANRTQSVERVVLTSSCAAIYGDNADLADAPGGVLTEDVWNTSSTLGHQPYSFSKTEAEREAWRIADAQDRWRLVAVNPSFVIGPAIDPGAGSESLSLISRIGNGALKTGVPHLEIGAVDVRDVAEAHIRAGFLPGAEGRHIVSARTTRLMEIAEILRARFGGDYPLPKAELPKWMVWLVGPMADPTLTRRMVSRNVGWPFRADNTKSRASLGMEYRAIEPGLEEMFAQLIEAGRIKQR